MHTKLWFKAKRYGWGWYPCSWQGWAVLAMYIFVDISVATFVDTHSHSASDALMVFFPVIYIMTVFLLIICYTTGEKPGWRWGGSIKSTAGLKVIDVLDPEGNATGETADIYDIHQHGHWHRTANIYIVNSKNEVLCQKRSKNHFSMPNMWQLPVGGHVMSGQTSLETAIHEAKEEMGVGFLASELVCIGTSIDKTEKQIGQKYNYEYQDIYVLYKDIPETDFKRQESEVEEIKWISLEEARTKLAAHDSQFVYHPSTTLFFEYMDSHGSDKN